jgi:probable HAF family extracellular repeat protein
MSSPPPPKFIYTTLNDPLATTYTTATGINDAGQIVGYYVDGSGVQHGFLYSNGTYATFDDPLATSGVTRPYGINNAGQIVGFYTDNTGEHGFLYSNGTYTTLDDPLGVGTTDALGINNEGQIVGNGFIYSNGTYTGFDGRAFGINNAGQIVGVYGGGFRGFIYSNGAYTATIDPSAYPTTTEPLGINNAGQVVGGYLDLGRSTSPAFLATPVTQVFGVTVSPSSGDENTGNTITFTVKMGDRVTVTGTPALTLNDGGTAIYQSGSGTDTLVFSTTIANGQNAGTLAVTGNNVDGVAIEIIDTFGNEADLSGADVSFPGLAVGATVTLITANPTAGDLGPGKLITFKVTLSEAVKIAGLTASTKPFLTLSNGGKAVYSGGLGTNVLTFTYKIGATGSGQDTAALGITGFNANGATIYDSNIKADTADLSGVTAFSGGPQIDTTAPICTTLSASAGRQ